MTPRWSRVERIDDAIQRYSLPRRSVGECVIRLVDAGYEPERAATLMLEAYESAIQRQVAYHEPWLQKADQLVNERRRENVS